MKGRKRMECLNARQVTLHSIPLLVLIMYIYTDV